MRASAQFATGAKRREASAIGQVEMEGDNGVVELDDRKGKRRGRGWQRGFRRFVMNLYFTSVMIL